MVEDFELPIGRLKKISNGEIFQHINHKVGRIDPEKLKLWLEEATKPRYYVKKHAITTKPEYVYQVRDSENNHEILVVFHEENNSFDAKAEAEKLCKQLNEGG